MFRVPRAKAMGDHFLLLLGKVNDADRPKELAEKASPVSSVYLMAV
jgi:hypothetical protein